MIPKIIEHVNSTIMKKISVLVFILLIIQTSCVMEPPHTCYSFIIINETKWCLLIGSKTVPYDEHRIDTIKPYKEFVNNISELGYFQNYHDTLISTFFRDIKILVNGKNLPIDAFNRHNWNESKYLRGIPFYRYGIVCYTMVIKEGDLKSLLSK